MIYDAIVGESPLVLIKHQLLKEKEVQLFLKREELLHPHLQGNKWRKLKYNVEAAKKADERTLLTFGGAHSNHIYATAAAGKLFGFETIGVIRGERPTQGNSTLSFAEKSGMHLHFVTRMAYKEKEDNSFKADLQTLFGNFYEIPEGGSNLLAVRGVAELAKELPDDTDVVALACGTGATAAGLLVGAHLFQKKYTTLPFSVLKGGAFLETAINLFFYSFFDENNVSLPDINTNNEFKAAKNAIYSPKFNLHTSYHHGGYAKNSIALQAFIDDWYNKTGILIEHVYTGKMLFGLFDLIQQDKFPKGTKIVAIHTGGLRL